MIFGESILAGCNILANAIQEGIARQFIIVGEIGHTTTTLQQKVSAIYPDLETTHMPEAELYPKLLSENMG